MQRFQGCREKVIFMDSPTNLNHSLEEVRNLPLRILLNKRSCYVQICNIVDLNLVLCKDLNMIGVEGDPR